MKKWILLLCIAATGCATAVKPPPLLKIQLPSTFAPKETRQGAYEAVRIQKVEDGILFGDGSIRDNMSLINKTWYDTDDMRYIFKDCGAKQAYREITAGKSAHKTAMIVMPLAPVVGAAVGTIVGWFAGIFSNGLMGASSQVVDRSTAVGAGVGGGIGLLAGTTVGLFKLHRWHSAPKKAADFYNSWLVEQLDLSITPAGGTGLKFEQKF